jgi:hypothetical protein
MASFKRFESKEIAILLKAMDSIHFTSGDAAKLHARLVKEMTAEFEARGLEMAKD